MEDKKILGMKFNVLMGLHWIVFPLGIVALAVDHDKMTRDEKLQIVQVFIFDAIGTIFSTAAAILSTVFAFVPVLNIIFLITEAAIGLFFFILFLIYMINAFMGNLYEVPVCYNMAKSFVKEDNSVKSDKDEDTEVKVDIVEEDDKKDNE